MKVFTLFLLCCSMSAWASIFGIVRTEGKVKDFDDKNVTLVDEDGKAFKVLRAEIPKKYKIRSGEKVVIEEKAKDVIEQHKKVNVQ